MTKYIDTINELFSKELERWTLKFEFKKTYNQDIHWLSISIQELNSYRPSEDWFVYRWIWWLYVDENNVDEVIQHIIMCITSTAISCIQDVNWMTKEYDFVKKPL